MVSRPAIFESTFWLSIYPSSFSAGKRAQQLGMLRIYAKHQVAATPASALNFPRFMGFITGAEDQDSLTEFGPRCISCAPERERPSCRLGVEIRRTQSGPVCLTKRISMSTA